MNKFFDDLKKYRNPIESKPLETPIQEAKEDSKTTKFSSKLEENNFYYSQVNPENGFRFNIPMLDTKDPEYFYKYIHYMKIKESSEETFKKIMGWE